MNKEVIRFELSGKTAFFKKNTTNKIYFTYNNIHSVVLKGLLGAILGLSGYDFLIDKKKQKKLPRFYTELEKLGVGIIPQYEKGNTSFSQTKINFTDTTTFSNTDGTLIVTQYWLNNPKWIIYLTNEGIDNDLWEKLKDYLLNQKSEFIPYLGTNSHLAKITNVALLKGEMITSKKIDSIFYKEEENKFNILDINKSCFTEKYPIKLNENIGYIEKLCYFTEKSLTNEIEVLKVEDKNIFLL